MRDTENHSQLGLMSRMNVDTSSELRRSSLERLRIPPEREFARPMTVWPASARANASYTAVPRTPDAPGQYRLSDLPLQTVHTCYNDLHFTVCLGDNHCYGTGYWDNLFPLTSRVMMYCPYLHHPLTLRGLPTYTSLNDIFLGERITYTKRHRTSGYVTVQTKTEEPNIGYGERCRSGTYCEADVSSPHFFERAGAV
jgi:hypothetical protein